MNLGELLEKDLYDMLAVKQSMGFSKSTYEIYVKQFVWFCGDKYPDCHCINKDIVLDWIRIRAKESANTQIRRIIALREFTKYQASVGKETFIPPSEYLKTPTRYVPYILSDYEVSKLFKAIDSVEPYYESPHREYIIPVLFRMMYCCGLRPGEPLKLKLIDANLDSGELFIRESKRGKDRHIYMSEDLTSLCRKYNMIMGKREFFFQQPDGTQYPTYWMTNQFKMCWKRTGLDNEKKHPRAYDLRHNYATRMMMKWVDAKKDIISMVPYLSAYMGHATFSATLYYIHLLPERLVKSSGIEWDAFSNIYPEVKNEKD